MEALTARLSSTSATMGASADEGGCRGPAPGRGHARLGAARAAAVPGGDACTRWIGSTPDGVRASGEGHRSGNAPDFGRSRPMRRAARRARSQTTAARPIGRGRAFIPTLGGMLRARGGQGGRRGGRTEVAKAHSAERRFDVPTGDRGIACLLDRWTGAGEPVLPRVERCLSCDAGKAGKATVCGSFWSKVMACGRPRLQACKPWPLRRLLG